ncbi:BTAD domain-containing putative transcriptional regulator [Gordonia sp. CPCC 205515]|uniref:BTAD domain-containing putative transcriptional regulator n=1 Tax=Gordonia sp. CPCC 205515 TaxID=3140791 RepID=UPI003AF346BA
MSATATRTVIGLLGPVAVGAEDAGPDDLVPVPGIRARRLLVSLALADGRTRSAERLIEDIWAGEPPRSPVSALHTQISRLRPLLGGGRLEGVGNGYRLVDCQTDLDIVADLVRSPEPADVDAAMRWWRGTPGDDLGDGADLVTELRRRADRLQDAVDERRLGIALATGDFGAARLLADKRCAADPLDESAHVDLMRALAGEGRTADALAVFARLRRTLSQQLGVDPGPQAVALNAELVAAEGEDRHRAVAPTTIPARARTVGLIGETSELIGRGDDIATILGLFDRHRLVTVQGPGGVGKTRVAQRVGSLMADKGRPVFYVPLAPIRNDDDVVGAIAATLGVGETDLGGGGRPKLAIGDLADRLVDAVRGQRAVLIFDNCEQVVERCARVAADLLAAEPQLSILTTSRSPLMLAAERIYLLPVLDVGERGSAVELFERRARAIRPAARLSAPEVAELCRHLDGLPLAIELAAARIRTMTVAEISARLVERFALLRGTDRTAPDRHRTLYAVIEWSWDLLEPDAQTAMRRLCRFPAGFTVDAASTVLGQNGFGLVDTLEAVVNQSLLTVVESDGHIRYRMLEMVREFGEEKLAAETGESDTVDRAMWQWARQFATDAETLYGERVDEQLFDRIAADVENLVWVLRGCTGVTQDSDAGRVAEAIDTMVTVFPVLGGFWMARGLHGEVMAWGGRIMKVLPTPPTDPDDEARRRWQGTILASMAHLLMQRDLRGVATGRYYLRRLHRPEHVYDEPTELMSAIVLSPNVSAAMRYVVRGTSSPTERVRIAALSARMNVRENFGDLDRALADGLALREVAKGQRNTWMLAMTQTSIGGIHAQRGQWSAGIPFYREAIESLARLGARDDEMQARSFLAASLVALGRYDDAAAELDVVSGGWTPDDPDPQGNPEVIGGMMVSTGELEYARGNRDSAQQVFLRAAGLIDREHPFGAQDPGMVILVGAAIIGMMRTGNGTRAAEYVALLADGLHSMLGPVGWFDMPQAGSLAMASGYVLSGVEPDSPDGPRLLALSLILGARHDYPGLQYVHTHIEEVSGLTAEDWAEVRDDTQKMSRRQALDEVRTILAPRQSAKGLSDHVLRM